MCTCDVYELGEKRLKMRLDWPVPISVLRPEERRQVPECGPGSVGWEGGGAAPERSSDSSRLRNSPVPGSALLLHACAVKQRAFGPSEVVSPPVSSPPPGRLQFPRQASVHPGTQRTHFMGTLPVIFLKLNFSSKLSSLFSWPGPGHSCESH